MAIDSRIELPTDPDALIDVWRLIGLGDDTLPDEQSPPVQWDRVVSLARGELDDELAVVVAGMVRRFRPWRQAFQATLVADIERRATTRANLPNQRARDWLLGLVRGLAASDGPDPDIRREIGDILDAYAGRGRPTDGTADLWDVLIGIVRHDAKGDQTRRDTETVSDNSAEEVRLQTSVDFAQSLLAATVERLRRAREWEEDSVRRIALLRLAGATVPNIASELGEEAEVVGIGLRIVHDRWSTEDTVPAGVG